MLGSAKKSLLKLDLYCDVIHLLYHHNEKELWCKTTNKMISSWVTQDTYIHYALHLPPSKREITSYKRVSINNRWFYLVGFFLSEDHLCYYLFPVEVKIWLPCACVWEQSAMLMPPLVSECAEGAGEEEGWSEEHNGKLHCTPGSCGKEWDFPGGEVVCP